MTDYEWNERAMTDYEWNERAKFLNSFKRNFQKTISKIRADWRIEQNIPAADYPKAMMTNQQMMKNTATVNCGGEWLDSIREREIADRVMNDERFQKLLADFKATAEIERSCFGIRTYPGFQIRIHY